MQTGEDGRPVPAPGGEAGARVLRTAEPAARCRGRLLLLHHARYGDAGGVRDPLHNVKKLTLPSVLMADFCPYILSILSDFNFQQL